MKGRIFLDEADHETITAPTQGWSNSCYTALEKSHYKSSELKSEGVMYLSQIFWVMLGFIVLSLQTSLQQIFQSSTFSLEVS